MLKGILFVIACVTFVVYLCGYVERYSVCVETNEKLECDRYVR